MWLEGLEGLGYPEPRFLHLRRPCPEDLERLRVGRVDLGRMTAGLAGLEYHLHRLFPEDRDRLSGLVVQQLSNQLHEVLDRLSGLVVQQLSNRLHEVLDRLSGLVVQQL